jgi:two-component system, NarL family, sensor kinase
MAGGDVPPFALAGRTRRWVVAAFGLFALVVLGVVTAGTAASLSGLTFGDAVDGFVVTNVAIGLSCGTAGVLIAWQRPRYPLGWLLLAAGVAHSVTAAAAPMVVLGMHRGWSESTLRTLDTIFAFAWPWAIALFLPLALLVFPDGLLPGRFWRLTVWFTVLTSPLFVVAVGADPTQEIAGRTLDPWLVLADHARLAPLWIADEIANLAVFVAAVGGLILRYRRADEQRRRQLLWLVLALILMIVVMVPWGLFTAGPILELLSIALVPAAMTIAVLRHQLLDIRLVLSRTVLYGLLTAAVIGVYLGLVAGADVVLRRAAGLGTSVLATMLIALGFNPVRVRLQRAVDRAIYGDRADPVRLLSRMGERLSAVSELDGVLAVVADALRLPYAALRRDSVCTAVHGTAPEATETLPLRYRSEQIGDLVVGVRPGQGALNQADRAALALLAVPLAAAMHATALSAAVQRSREQIVGAREEERRRLRRDLHDGLGPVLTGIALRADAAGNVLRTDPAKAGGLLREVRSSATEAIDEVRRLVYALRPPVLDELGLVGALRRHAGQFEGRDPDVAVHAPESLPPLPAAVEATAYRIVVEALTNAVRHANATRIDVHVSRLAGTGSLALCVTDDGPGDRDWVAGVGLTAMRERIAELGGTLTAGPARSGGQVSARLPL